MERRQRIKPYNLGAALPLLPEDLFKATWFPTNVGIHMVKLIGSPEGEIEYGEYLSRPPEPPRFAHATFVLPAAQLGSARAALDVLRGLRPTTFYEDAEEPQRRSLSLWAAGRARTHALPAPEEFRRLRITRAYRTAFEAAWQAIADAVQPVRSLHAPGLSTP